MEYITVSQAAEKWGISTRRVQILCGSDRIKGVVRFGPNWMIPADAERPEDGRGKSGGKKQTELTSVDMPLPRKTPFLYMSDLYTIPGSSAEVVEGLAYNPEAQALFEAEIAYSRGDIDKVYESASFLLNKHSGFYAIISAGMLLALCAIWKGDLEMWRRAKLHVSEARIKSEYDREIITLAITAVDSMLYDIKDFPEWFKIGCFEPLPKDALPAAKVYYAKYLYAAAHALATGEIRLDGVKGLTLMDMLPCTIEPMISQAKADETVIAEMYLRMTCAVIYYHSNKKEQALRHLDRAISLALPDRLYGFIAEYCRTLYALIEMRMMQIDENAWREVERLYKIYNAGWSKLHSRGTVSCRTHSSLFVPSLILVI